MRTTLAALVGMLAVAAAVSAQGMKGASAEAQSANKHYGQGWSAMRAESWDAAAREFQQAIDSDPRFALAYYSLGRAEMGRRDFPKAIAAYVKCQELYAKGDGEQFSNQVESRQRLTDRIFEYQTARNQATSQTSAAKAGTQSQSLYIRELDAEIARLEQARDRSINVSIGGVSVPYYVPMALGAAYFRSGQFADAEREYKDALVANAASGETHNNLAVLFLVTNRIDEAESEVKAAEKVGFKVNENLKGDIRKKKSGG